MDKEEIQRQKVILFDGVCNLCNGSVIFVLEQERNPIHKFASIQSDTGRDLLERCGLPGDYNQAVILLDRGKVYSGSTAALRIVRTLKFPWSLLSYVGLLVPKSIRDWVYRQIATHRYQWFGKRNVCMIPTNELRSRFYE